MEFCKKNMCWRLGSSHGSGLRGWVVLRKYHRNISFCCQVDAELEYIWSGHLQRLTPKKGGMSRVSFWEAQDYTDWVVFSVSPNDKSRYDEERIGIEQSIEVKYGIATVESVVGGSLPRQIVFSMMLQMRGFKRTSNVSSHVTARGVLKRTYGKRSPNFLPSPKPQTIKQCRCERYSSKE